MSYRNSDQSGGRRSSESSGAHSWLSQETVREGRSQHQQHSHEPSNGRSVSPLSGFRDTDRPDPQSCTSPTFKDPNDLYSSLLSWGSSDFAPKDQRKPPQFGSHRKALAVLGTDDPGPPPTNNSSARPSPSNLNHSDSHQQDPEPSLSSSPMIPPTDAPSTFFHDYSEQEPSPAHHFFRPGTAQTYASEPLELDYNGDHRRPSVASAMTVSSQGSKSSAGALFRKKLQGFFGDEYVGNGESKHDSDNFTQSSATKPSSLDHFRARERANSDGSRNSGASQAQNQARTQTPLPSSDITPWLYQSYHDIPQYGEAPVREAPTAATDSQRGSISQRDHGRRHFSGHRHSRSKEEKPTVAGDLAGYSSRPATGRDDLSLELRPSREGSLNYPTPMTSSTTLVGRSTSPTPSVQSAYSREQGQNSPGTQTSKRSFLDKIRRPKHGHLKNITGAKAVQETTKAASSKLSRRDASPARRGRQGSIESGTSSRLTEPGDTERRKDSKGLAISSAKLRGRRGHGNEIPSDVDIRKPGVPNMWALDTDLTHMEGIVNPPSPSAQNKMLDGASIRSEEMRRPDPMPAGNWDAPESWHVKKSEPSNVLPQDTSEPGPTISEPGGSNWYIRIFRQDATFATLSSGLYSTVTELVQLLSRKSFFVDPAANYELIMQKNGLSRQVDQTEMPILMQKRMLEQLGYTEKDRIEEVGREDHSYILRYTYLPILISGSVIEGHDPPLGKTQQKFSHVDLTNRSLLTIPIGLYKKAPEIISLNLSRNLALDVPKDFIQGCINLREIKFMGNEALRLPASFGLAGRLTYLDVSNNCLEDLTHANLDRLHSLVSIKLANNRLTSLPDYFGNFRGLRSLNISSNSFHAFPELLSRLKSLVDLDISFNHIPELLHIGKLTTLERLWMTNNIVRGPLGDTFRDLANLREIDARFNEITNIDILCLLPRLELIDVGHNAISKFKGSFPKLRALGLDHCPMTQFDIDAPVPTLRSLNIASAKLVQFRDSLFENVPNLQRLILDKNHFVSMSPHIGRLRKLEHFSMIKNPLAALPATIGCLTDLKYLNLRECNLRKLPPELWHCVKLETLNVSSNVLDVFPKHGCPQPQVPSEVTSTPAATPGISTTPSYEELGALDEQEARRPSQASGGVLSTGNSPNGGTYRKPSVASSLGQGRKVSAASRSLTDGSPSSRKDSNFSQHLTTTFAGSLRNLYLADNRLEDDIFRELSLLPELRIVNLSYNELTELPQGLLRRWPLLTELYISGNELISLPSDDLEEGSNLKVLHINANRFQVLPAELCKVAKLAYLDAGSNSLKYNVSNWPYDWNWNWNRNLRYLNFSGNKRLEIKPPGSSLSNQPQSSKQQASYLTDFTSLTHLRVLGLMDVTLTITTIPEENEDRRVRTSASLAGALAYGMADFLGKSDHLSIFDMIVPRLKPDKVETVVGMFDGQSQTGGGSRIAKFLHENFIHTFSSELKRMRPEQHETPLDALRRAFLNLNKNMAFACYKSLEQDVRQYQEDSTDQRRVRLTKDDIDRGGAATVMYINNMDLYVANVGDAQAILVKSDGSMRHLTQNHDPAEAHERERIRAAGGFVSRTGKLNDVLTVSRSFGYFQMMPAVIAAPHTMHVNLTEQDEMVILASRELWDYVTPDLVVDVTRAERRDLMIAAQKIRDLALSFGATDKLMVMVLGVGDLRRREKIRTRPSLSMVGPPEEQIIPSVKRTKKPRDAPGDSRLARFDYVDAPVGELAIIFTDIKKSTSLWETCPDAMRSAIQIHNDILRRQLGIIGGYEVKTEGDAFMVAFSTTTAALLWCFNCQTQLLEAEWPTEILEQPQCQTVYDSENNVIFRGLSVRMGSHWGEPVCEKDPVTNRMDYFGPMVNRASRVSAVADGGQIFVSSDFMSDIQRNLEIFADSERAASTGSEESYAFDTLGNNIRRELQQLNSQGFVIKDQGERKLKGLENPEPLYLIYPHALSGRLTTVDKDTSNELAPTTISKHSQLEIQTDLIWRLWEITLRLERLCAALEYPGEARLKEPNVALFNVVKNHGGELADSTVVSLVEQQVTRIEVCITSLSIRNMMRPFRPGDRLNDHAVPIADVMQQLQTQLAEYRALKEQIDASAGTATSYTGTDPQYSNGESNSDSASSSYLQIGPPSDEFNPGGPRP